MTRIERIDQYLGNQLSADEVAALERDLQHDSELRAVLASVDLARRSIRTQAIRAEVQRVHQEFITDYRQSAPADQPADAGAPVLPLSNRPARANQPFGWVLRIAATVLLGVVGYGGYQLATLGGQTVYDENFVAYHLPTPRDMSTGQSVLDSLYRAGDYQTVVERMAVMSPQQRQPQSYFLTAMAYLQLRQYDAALGQFRTLRATNQKSAVPFFEQETDYYEALAHLRIGTFRQAYAGFKRIYDDPRHMFHDNVSSIDLWKVRFLSFR